MLKHWDGLMVLKKHTLIWPDPVDFFQQGSKLYIASLAQAVAKSEGQCYPICATVKPTAKLVEDIISGKRSVVLKREWGTAASHVYYKGMEKSRVDLFNEQLKRRTLMEKKLEKHKPHVLLNTSPKWFIQPYIHSLTRIGELRILIVNGAILGKIVTTPLPDPENPGAIGYMHLQQPILVPPLSVLKYSVSKFVIVECLLKSFVGKFCKGIQNIALKLTMVFSLATTSARLSMPNTLKIRAMRLPFVHCRSSSLLRNT